MRITEVTIRLEPNAKEIEDGKEAITIHRNSEKLWLSDRPDGSLLPYEIRLINNFQEEVLSKFNSQDNK